MSRPGYQPAPYGPARANGVSDIAQVKWVQHVVDVINDSLAGKMNVTLSVTLPKGSTSTVIVDARIDVFSGILLNPVTASAAALDSSIYVASQQNGQLTLSYNLVTADDSTFTMTIIG